jgi:hypothetical protein
MANSMHTRLLRRAFHFPRKPLKSIAHSDSFFIADEVVGIAGGSATLHTGHGSPAPQSHSLGQARRGWFSHTSRHRQRGAIVAQRFLQVIEVKRIFRPQVFWIDRGIVFLPSSHWAEVRSEA